MTLEVHLHPLSSYCWKLLIALYELDAPFEPLTVDLGDPAARAAYLALSPFGKIPALRDHARAIDLFETSVIIEYLDRHYPGPVPLIPQNEEAARDVRLRDRIFDLYVHNVFQRIVADRLRPEGANDPFGVEQARAELRAAYGVLERDFAGRRGMGEVWAAGQAFSLADCAAAPALFYADVLEPFGEGHPALAAYASRLMARPSVARAIAEAQPFFGFFPANPTERSRLPAQP